MVVQCASILLVIIVAAISQHAMGQGTDNRGGAFEGMELAHGHPHNVERREASPMDKYRYEMVTQCTNPSSCDYHYQCCSDFRCNAQHKCESSDGPRHQGQSIWCRWDYQCASQYTCGDQNTCFCKGPGFAHVPYSPSKDHSCTDNSTCPNGYYCKGDTFTCYCKPGDPNCADRDLETSCNPAHRVQGSINQCTNPSYCDYHYQCCSDSKCNAQHTCEHSSGPTHQGQSIWCRWDYHCNSEYTCGDQYTCFYGGSSYAHVSYSSSEDRSCKSDSNCPGGSYCKPGTFTCYCSPGAPNCGRETPTVSSSSSSSSTGAHQEIITVVRHGEHDTSGVAHGEGVVTQYTSGAFQGQHVASTQQAGANVECLKNPSYCDYHYHCCPEFRCNTDEHKCERSNGPIHQQSIWCTYDYHCASEYTCGDQSTCFYMGPEFAHLPYDPKSKSQSCNNSHDCPNGYYCRTGTFTCYTCQPGALNCNRRK